MSTLVISLRCFRKLSEFYTHVAQRGLISETVMQEVENTLSGRRYMTSQPQLNLLALGRNDLVEKTFSWFPHEPHSHSSLMGGYFAMTLFGPKPLASCPAFQEV